jgi:tetratricopeptide (TPR) repeat protein
VTQFTLGSLVRWILLPLLFITSICSANSLQSIVVRASENAEITKISFTDPVAGPPTVFELEAPYRIVVDLPSKGPEKRDQEFLDKPHTREVKVLATPDRTRIVITLDHRMPYRILLRENVLTVVVAEAQQPEVVMITNKRTPEELLALAKKVLAENGDTDDALESLNAILMMSPTAATMEAQELAGFAQEKAGKFEKAKAEYKFYLTMYPDSPEFKRIQQRLISLEIAQPKVIASRFEARQPHQGVDAKTAASVSEYYYISSNSPSATSFQRSDSALITNGRVTGTYRADEITTKVAIRYSRTDNLMHPESSKQNLSTVSVDVQDTFRDMGIKVGRMTSGYGTLGRFDGIVANYAMDPKSKVVLLGGVPYVGTSSTSRKFFGVGYQLDTEKFSGDLYYNHSIADGHAERQAVGVEVFQSSQQLSSSLIVEYDLLYKALNTLMFQGRTSLGFTSPYFMIDHRKAPVLFAERSTMLGFGTIDRKPFTSVGDVFANSGLSQDQIYKYIAGSTPMSTTFMLGTTTTLTPKWTLGSDIQVSSISGTSIDQISTLDLPASITSQAGTGKNTTLNLMLSGTDTWYKGNNLNVITSFMFGGGRGTSITVVDNFKYGQMSFELLGRYFVRTQPGLLTTNTGLSVRLNYYFSESLALDTAFSITRTSLLDLLNAANVTSYNQSFYLGVRTDF